MRTLSRPMFNMGGPIKQGIMHGIREPYRGGGQAALVGNPLYPRTGGREHHVAPILGIAGINAARWLATIGGRKLAQKAAQKTFQNVGKNYTGTLLPAVTKQPSWASRMGEKISGAIPGKVKSWFKADPLYGTIAGGTSAFGRGAKWTGKKLYGAAKYGVTTPSGIALTAAGTYGLWPDGTPKESPAGVPLNPNLQANIAAKKELSTEKKKEFALQQRDARVEKYLEMMGYNRAKKTAIADALIDASKLVSDRGTLDKKNITGELINPAIQALSKRLDKPEQIREAVGLMAVKAAIQKDMEDPQVKKLRALQIEKGEQELGENFETDMRNLLLSRKDKVNKKTLEQYARLTADKYGEPFTQVTEDTDLTTLDNGIYMSEDKIIRVTDGVPQRIV